MLVAARSPSVLTVCGRVHRRLPCHIRIKVTTSVHRCAATRHCVLLNSSHCRKAVLQSWVHAVSVLRPQRLAVGVEAALACVVCQGRVVAALDQVGCNALLWMRLRL